MPQQKRLPGLRFSIEAYSENQFKIGLEWDQDEDIDISTCLISLLAYARSPDALKDTIAIYKKACRKMKRKDLFDDFMVQLKNLTSENIAMNTNTPMISPMEVLGKRRLS
jgi:hypothetical protein